MQAEQTALRLLVILLAHCLVLFFPTTYFTDSSCGHIMGQSESEEAAPCWTMWQTISDTLYNLHFNI